MDRILFLLGWAVCSNTQHGQTVINRISGRGLPSRSSVHTTLRRGDELYVILSGHSEYFLATVEMSEGRLSFTLVKEGSFQTTMAEASREFAEFLAEDGQGPWTQVEIPRPEERRSLPRVPAVPTRTGMTMPEKEDDS